LTLPLQIRHLSAPVLTNSLLQGTAASQGVAPLRSLWFEGLVLLLFTGVWSFKTSHIASHIKICLDPKQQQQQPLIDYTIGLCKPKFKCLLVMVHKLTGKCRHGGACFTRSRSVVTSQHASYAEWHAATLYNSWMDPSSAPLAGFALHTQAEQEEQAALSATQQQDQEQQAQGQQQGVQEPEALSEVQEQMLMAYRKTFLVAGAGLIFSTWRWNTVTKHKLPDVFLPPRAQALPEPVSIWVSHTGIRSSSNASACSVASARVQAVWGWAKGPMRPHRPSRTCVSVQWALSSQWSPAAHAFTGRAALQAEGTVSRGRG
jgi:hypothetical protein